jgi:hypothetical protein
LIDRIDVLDGELKAIEAEFGQLMQANAPLMQSIQAKMMQGRTGALDSVEGREVVWSNDAFGNLKAEPRYQAIPAD